MQCQFSDEEVFCLVQHQLKQIWGDIFVLSKDDMNSLKNALRRTEECFKDVRAGYFHKDEKVIFHIEHSVQYMVFLYYLSNCFHRNGKDDIASAVYYLNKSMNSVELFYAVELPAHFCMEHPLGTVLGRAQYGDHFFVYQGCTVGGNQKGGNIYYPVIGNYVTMYSNSKILGNCYIGDNVIIGANAYIKDMDIPSNCMVFGQYPNVIIKEKQEEKIMQIKEHLWLI